MKQRASLLLTFIMLLATACAGNAPGARGPSEVAAPVAPRRLVAAIRSAPPTVSADLNTIIPGTIGLARLVSSGLTVVTDDGDRVPLLSEAVPTIENGLWQVLPDGRMETTWRIKPGARWHDGTAFTATDAVFTAKVRQDAELPLFRNPAFALVETVEAPDAQTVLIRWKQPFIDADMLFEDALLPAHLLEPLYLDNRASFDQTPYWNEAFVGNGPFKVREWAAGSYVTLEAFEQYVLGRPRIGEIEVRFIPDGATLIANILSGTVQLTVGARNLSFEEAADVREQWREGAVVPFSRSVIFLFPQYINPSEPAILNVQFRRALLYAIDREELGRTFQGGLGAVPHGYLSPDVPEYREIQSAATVYDYDPRLAVQLIEGLGYTRGPDGFFRDLAGRRLDPEVRTTTLSENQKVMLSVVDYWQRAGIAAEPHTVPQARAQEGEYRAAFPGFEIVRQGDGKGMLINNHSARARLPANNFRGSGGGTNYPRFMNPILDGLIDRYVTTIPWQERMAMARQIIQLETDQVVAAGLIYSSDANMVANRVDNVSRMLWNAHQWTIR
jgi:peptide/nickel transport system substrate-binding protein